MSKVVTTTVLPDVDGTSLTIGAAGDNVVVTGNDLRTNAIQDAGGNTVLTSDGSGNFAGSNSGISGAYKLITTTTASNSAHVSFTSQLTSTYDVYSFRFINVNPATDGVEFTFQVSTNGGSSYGVNIASSFFYGANTEAASGGLSYHASYDLHNSTSFQTIGYDLGSGADEALNGEMHFYAPSDTTFIKHFHSRTNCYDTGGPAGGAQDSFAGGYVNTTTAINAIRFQMNSGNFDGIIKMYGISKS